jgi:hypothetical protein
VAESLFCSGEGNLEEGNGSFWILVSMHLMEGMWMPCHADASWISLLVGSQVWSRCRASVSRFLCCCSGILYIHLCPAGPRASVVWSFGVTAALRLSELSVVPWL